MGKHKPLVFLDVSVDGDPYERMIFELFNNVAPETAENFRALCTGEKGDCTRIARPLHYKGTFFHRVVRGSMAKGGDLAGRLGNWGESIYGESFPDESPKLKHDSPGLLSMEIADQNDRGSQFIITFKAAHHLDRKSIVFGKLVHGIELLKKIENVGDEDGRPSVTVKIINSGELHGDKRKLYKLKLGKDGSPEINNDENRHKGKHKRTSKEKRKRRKRQYSSDSYSSSSDDTDSSDSDSESDSHESSSTSSSSSSDDRRRKRKRSKRDKHRRGRKDRRREKRRKRRDKRSKRKTRRALDSSSDSESGKEGVSKDNNAETQGPDTKHKNLVRMQSPQLEEGGPVLFRESKKESADKFDREEGEYPKENGESQSNGIGVDGRSHKSTEKQPDIVDDHPDKSRSRSRSRSRSMSPKISMSKSMSISPRRSSSSRSTSPKRKLSRTRSLSSSPQRTIRRGRSISPARSASSLSPIRSVSRSPVRGKKGRSAAASPPARDRLRKSSSKNLSASPPRRPSRSPPKTTSRRSSWKSASRSPVRSSRRSLSRSLVRPGSVNGSPVRVSRRSVSRSSGRDPSRRIPSLSPIRAPSRNNRHSYSRSPRGGSRRGRSPIPVRGRSSSRSPSVEGSSKRTRKGRGFSDRYSYVRRYRSRTPDRSPVRSYRYGGRSDRDRYPSYRRSPRRYRSPARGRTPPRFRGRRSRSNSRSISRSPIHYRRRYSPSPARSRSPVDRYRGSPRVARRRSPSPSRSRSLSQSPPISKSPKRVSKEKSRSSSGSPPVKAGLVSYDDGSPDSVRD